MKMKKDKLKTARPQDEEGGELHSEKKHKKRKKHMEVVIATFALQADCEEQQSAEDAMTEQKQRKKRKKKRLPEIAETDEQDEVHKHKKHKKHKKIPPAATAARAPTPPPEQHDQQEAPVAQPGSASASDGASPRPKSVSWTQEEVEELARVVGEMPLDRFTWKQRVQELERRLPGSKHHVASWRNKHLRLLYKASFPFKKKGSGAQFSIPLRPLVGKGLWMQPLMSGTAQDVVGYLHQHEHIREDGWSEVDDGRLLRAVRRVLDSCPEFMDMPWGPGVFMYRPEVNWDVPPMKREDWEWLERVAEEDAQRRRALLESYQKC